MTPQAGWQIIAKQGSDRYLIDVGDEKARVLDARLGVLYAPWHRESIIARGYWEAYTPTDGEMERLLADVREQARA